MAFDYSNPGMAGRYPRPMHLMQQMDFSTMPLSSYTDITNLMEVTGVQQCNSAGMNPQISGNMNLSGLNENNKPLPLDFNMGVRPPQTEFSMSSVSNFSSSCIQSTEPFVQHIQPFQNHMLSGNPYHYNSTKFPMVNKSCGGSTSTRQPMNNKMESIIPEDISAATKPRKRKTSSKSKKEKKQKFKRVRYIKPGCSEHCRRRCKEKISQCSREDIFNEYWNLEDDTQKRNFIARNAIKMPMMKCKEGSRRSFSVDWAFTVKGESYSVCKLFFLHTLDIPENTAYSAIKESAFCNDDAPRIETKDKKKYTQMKAMWFETDLDDYSNVSKKSQYSKEGREESFTKRERFREMRPGCSGCRRNCQSKFSNEERLAIFNEYRSLSNIRKQRDYIAKYINRTERKRIRPGLTTRRGCSIEWSLPLKGYKIPVCKTYFLHTVGISERSAYNIGLQNDIKPADRTKRRRKAIPFEVTTVKSKSAKSVIAKGKLKSALKLSRKKKFASDCSDAGDEEDFFDDLQFDSYTENQKDCGNKGIKKKRTISGKSDQFEKQVNNESVENSIHDINCETSLDEGQTDGSLKMKVASSLFKLPIKKRENVIQSTVPVLKIKKERINSLGSSPPKRKRNPYKRKDMPTHSSFPLCPDDCTKRCRQNLSEEAQKEIFEAFWALKNMNEQKEFISKCVKKEAKNTCGCLIASKLREKRRGYKIRWNLNFRGLEVPVCKTFFMHVLQISDSVVYRAIRNDEQFMPNASPLPCKHFTGQNQSQNSSNADEEVKNELQCEMQCHENDTDDDSESQLDSLLSEDDSSANPDASCESSSCEMSNSGRREERGDNITRTYPAQPPSFEPTTQDLGIGNDKNRSLNNSGVGSALCNIEANYESLIPSLNAEEPRDMDQSLLPIPPTVPTQLNTMAQYSHDQKMSNLLSASQGLIALGSRNDQLPKHMDNYHQFSGHNPSVFPTLVDFRMDAFAGNSLSTHPRDLHHLSFPVESRHQTRFTAQANFPSHPFPYHHPDVPASSINQPFPSAIGNDMMGNFFHNPRFHGLNVPISSECSLNKSSHAHYNHLDGDVRGSNNALGFQPLNNTNDNVFLSESGKSEKAKKRRKKPQTKPKQLRVASAKVKKRREEKPFTRHVKSGCTETCKRRCSVKIPREAREKIFDEFWKLENDTKRREFILPIVSKLPKKSCSGVNSRRCCTIEWGIPYEGEYHVVCKRFFLDTFDIGEKFVKTIFDKIEKMGGSMQDMRGRHCKRSNVFMVEQDAIYSHVRSLATLKAIQCVHCKRDFTRWCMESGLSMAHFYKMYAEKRKSEGVKPACRATFTDICAKKFNIKMVIPKEDMCDQCISVIQPSQDVDQTAANII